MGLQKISMEKEDPHVTREVVPADISSARTSAPPMQMGFRNGSGQVVGLLEFDGLYPGDTQKNAAQAGAVARTHAASKPFEGTQWIGRARGARSFIRPLPAIAKHLPTTVPGVTARLPNEAMMKITC